MNNSLILGGGNVNIGALTINSKIQSPSLVVDNTQALANKNDAEGSPLKSFRIFNKSKDSEIYWIGLQQQQNSPFPTNLNKSLIQDEPVKALDSLNDSFLLSRQSQDGNNANGLKASKDGKNPNNILGPLKPSSKSVTRNGQSISVEGNKNSREPSRMGDNKINSPMSSKLIQQQIYNVQSDKSELDLSSTADDRKAKSRSGSPLKTYSNTGNVSSKSMPPNEETVIIHVCDENRKLNKDFKCQKRLLLTQMKYFEKYLSDVTSFEDIDISVHCDIQIFEWLMQYLQKKDAYNRGHTYSDKKLGGASSENEIQNKTLFSEFCANSSGVTPKLGMCETA